MRRSAVSFGQQRELCRQMAHGHIVWHIRSIRRRSTWSRSKMTTGSASFEGSSARKTFPEALLNSEMASATWPLVGCLFPAAMTILGGTSKVVLAEAGAGRAGGPITSLVRSVAVFGGRLESELAAGDRSSITASISCCFVEREDRMDAGTFDAIRIPAFSTL